VFAVGIDAGVSQRLAGDDQREELRAVGGVERVRGDAEGDRVEGNGLDEPAAGAPGLVGCLGVGVQVVLGGPGVPFGEVGDGAPGNRPAMPTIAMGCGAGIGPPRRAQADQQPVAARASVAL
jgi:hypothetical protein